MTANRNRQRGKECEREVAKILGGKRVGILGNEDVAHPIYSIEVKSRKTFVARKWMEQCKKNNVDDKIPLVVVHEFNRNHSNDLVLINITDFIEITALTGRKGK